MSLRAFTVLLISVWCCAIAFNAICAVTLWRRRLVSAFPVLTAYLIANLLNSLWLLRLYAVGDIAGYKTFWQNGQPLLICLCAMLVVEAIFRQASHFEGIATFAATLAAVFTIVSAAICLATAGIGINPSFVSTLMKVGRFFDLLCLLVLLLSRVLFALFDPRMRPNVRAHIAILAAFFTGGAIAAALLGFTGRGFNPTLVAGQILTVANPLLAYILWSLRLTPAGEVYEPLAREHRPLQTAAQRGLLVILRGVRRELLGRSTRRLI